MTLGPYEIQVWRDTGRPRFRVWFWRAPSVTRFDRWLYDEDWRPTYLWTFKVMSWWTLFVARRSRP
jgi:hypothetical protein